MGTSSAGAEPGVLEAILLFYPSAVQGWRATGRVGAQVRHPGGGAVRRGTARRGGVQVRHPGGGGGSAARRWFGRACAGCEKNGNRGISGLMGGCGPVECGPGHAKRWTVVGPGEAGWLVGLLECTTRVLIIIQYPGII
jgi:hypothetical protein